jgi:hypothetical protein
VQRAFGPPDAIGLLHSDCRRMDYPYGRQVFDRSRAAPVVTESDGALSALAEYDRARNWADWSGAKSSARNVAIPLFGYQNHISIDRGFGFIRRWTATDAAAYEGRRLREGLLDKANTASGIWADTAYRSAAKAFLTKNGFVSHIHRRKPKGRTMPEVTRRANKREIKNPLACRARVRRAEGAVGFVHPHHRHRTGDDQDRPPKPRL